MLLGRTESLHQLPTAAYPFLRHTEDWSSYLHPIKSHEGVKGYKKEKTTVRKKKTNPQNYSELTFPEMLLFEKFSSLTKRDDCLGAVYIQGNFDQMGFSIHLRYNPVHWVYAGGCHHLSFPWN